MEGPHHDPSIGVDRLVPRLRLEHEEARTSGDDPARREADIHGVPRGPGSTDFDLRELREALGALGRLRAGVLLGERLGLGRGTGGRRRSQL